MHTAVEWHGRPEHGERESERECMGGAGGAGGWEARGSGLAQGQSLRQNKALGCSGMGVCVCVACTETLNAPLYRLWPPYRTTPPRATANTQPHMQRTSEVGKGGGRWREGGRGFKEWHRHRHRHHGSASTGPKRWRNNKTMRKQAYGGWETRWVPDNVVSKNLLCSTASPLPAPSTARTVVLGTSAAW